MVVRNYRSMHVTERDKEKMRRLGESLEEAEEHELVSGAALAATIRWANQKRAEIGIPPLPVWEDEIEEMPEMIVWRRARALGLGHRRR